MKKVIRCNKVDESGFIANIDWQSLENKLTNMLRTDIQLNVDGLNFTSQDLSDHIGLMSQFIDIFVIYTDSGRIDIDDYNDMYYTCLINEKHQYVSGSRNGHNLYIATYDGHKWTFRYGI